eukprot:TRINITY_DN87_c0_g1_i1.p1 TRINITY_DN87_c0_g1~~TRINITY_DN87_c0_g1_i1.p1  ORF type:complete len:496 (+),score=94.79 TRINITY_DN87_c0_g1_i1:219-1706(+)
MDKEKIIVLGAGPTGLGAAHRLHELGYKNWKLIEKADGAGGLAASVVDSKGFTWDLGGHVIFSHYDYFDRLVDTVLKPKGGWLDHERESWVWMRNRYIPYPLQNNIWRLPAEDLVPCVDGLLEVYKANAISGRAAPKDFYEWIQTYFGAGLANVFMLPYNFKVWAYPAKEMSCAWMGERVAMVDMKRILSNIIQKKDDLGWGPNAQFRFPLHGGTGGIWNAVFETLPKENIKLGAEVVSIDVLAKIITFKDGSTETYDKLISTLPLDVLLNSSNGIPKHITDLSSEFKYSSSHIVGIGIKGGKPDSLKTKCWLYYPEDDVPFYRNTVFSNYSPYNVPDHQSGQWSLMLEISESPVKPVNTETIAQETVDACKKAGMILEDGEILSVWHTRLHHGYPTPFLKRDELLEKIQPVLKNQFQIWSRGRFGGWKYEVANQDHSCMQGVEAVDNVLFGTEEMTYEYPNVVNAKKSFARKNFTFDSAPLKDLASSSSKPNSH